jgi:hypothetical protein
MQPAALSPNPQIALPVFHDFDDGVIERRIGQGKRRTGVLDLFVVCIESIKPGCGPYPEPCGSAVAHGADDKPR